MNLRVRCKHLIADTILQVPIFLLAWDFGVLLFCYWLESLMSTAYAFGEP